MPAPFMAERRDAQSHRFDLEYLPVSRRFDVAVATSDEIAILAQFTAKYLPAVESAKSALSAVQEKSKSLLAIKTRNKLVGCFALLSLNDRGLEQLLSGQLWTAKPDLDGLTVPDERASAILVGRFVLQGMALGRLEILWSGFAGHHMSIATFTRGPAPPMEAVLLARPDSRSSQTRSTVAPFGFLDAKPLKVSVEKGWLR